MKLKTKIDIKSGKYTIKEGTQISTGFSSVHIVTKYYGKNKYDNIAFYDIFEGFDLVEDENGLIDIPKCGTLLQYELMESTIILSDKVVYYITPLTSGMML